MRGRTVAVGIDFGTTKCCVAVVSDGIVKVVENERGNMTTPSYVAFTDTERLLGDDARDQVCLNSTNTVFGIKGLMGRSYQQAVDYRDKNKLPFTLVDDRGKPQIKVNYLDQEIRLTPEQVAAMLLSKMKALAESHLGCPVTEAVISVPAYFNNSQRLATKTAAGIAGLKVLKLINEPTAAALTFKSIRPSSRKEESVVFLDIGGGTFDTAVVTFNKKNNSSVDLIADGGGGSFDATLGIKNTVDVVAVHGDCHFGGQCFDNFLMDHFVDEFRHKHGIDLREHKKSMERLRVACLKIKHTLTLLPKTRHTIDCILSEIDFHMEMTRKAFEEMSSRFIREKMHAVLVLLPQELLRQADHVVPVGGSSRVPKIQDFLTEFFEKKLTKTINPDEAVAYGAAFQAGQLLGMKFMEEVQVSDSVPHLIDVIPTWQPVETLMPCTEGTPPFKRNVSVNECTTLFEFVYYRDHSITEYNKLGTIAFPHGQHPNVSRLIPIQYYRDGDGIFQATLTGGSTRNDKGDLAHLELDCIDVKDIARMRRVETMFEDDHKKHLEQVQAYSDLEALCFRIKKNIESIQRADSAKEQNIENRESIKKADSAKALTVCDHFLHKLDENPNESLSVLRSYKNQLMTTNHEFL